MATFCTKCGATLTPETQFCTGCGAATGAVPAPLAAPIYAQPSAAQSDYSQPNYAAQYPPSAQYPAAAAVPPKSGGALKIVLIVVGVFVALGIVGASIFAFTIWRVSRAIHVNGAGDKVTINTPGGSISTDASETYSASDLGTDIYPGAQSAKGGMKMDLPTGSMITGIFTTSDPKSQVVSFYKGRFGSQASVMDMADAAILTVKKGEHETVMITISSKDSESDGKTKIAIVHTKSN